MQQTILDRLRPTLLTMRLLWAVVVAGKIVYLVLGRLLEGRIGIPELTPASLRLLTTAVAGGGAVLAVSSILIRVNLRRAAVHDSTDVKQYVHRLTTAQFIGLGLCDAWAVGALALRLLGSGAVVQIMLTSAALLADFFHYPMTADFVYDAMLIEYKKGTNAPPEN